MNRAPRSLLVSLLVSPLLGCADRGASAPREAGGPNVVLITVDTLNRDHLGCYGYSRATSPEVDRLAADSLVFERAYSQAPWTTPSLGSLLTSRYPSQLGIHDEVSVLPEEATLLSEILQRQGYSTGAVISHDFCSERWNFHQGFDSFDESNVKGYLEATSEGVTDRGLDFLAAQGDRPFFLWLHYFDPHGSYREHEGFSFLDPGADRGPFVASVIHLEDLQKIKPPHVRRDLNIVRSFYDSEVAYTDHHIGRFLDQLRLRDLYDSTLVVFTADHGEGFAEHGLMGHTTVLYNEVVNVPLLVKVPGVPPRRVSAPVPLLDVLPTVLEVTESPRPEGMQGRSLLSTPTDDRRSFFTESLRRCDLRAVVQGRYKLIHDRESGLQLLFDQIDDRGERQPLSRDHPAFAALLQTLEHREQQLEFPAARKISLSATEEQRLRELGYLEDVEPSHPGVPADDEDRRPL